MIDVVFVFFWRTCVCARAFFVYIFACAQTRVSVYMCRRFWLITSKVYRRVTFSRCRHDVTEKTESYCVLIR